MFEKFMNEYSEHHRYASLNGFLLFICFTLTTASFTLIMLIISTCGVLYVSFFETSIVVLFMCFVLIYFIMLATNYFHNRKMEAIMNLNKPHPVQCNNPKKIIRSKRVY